MKQKSLMGWFSKPPAGAQASAATKSQKPSVSAPKAQPTKDASKSVKSSDVTKSTEKKTDVQRLATSSSMASLKSSSGISNPRTHDTPPTSDAIDVDMQSDEEQSASIAVSDATLNACFSHISVFKQKKGKRKMVLDDSDNEIKAQKQSVKISPDIEDSPVINGTQFARVHNISHEPHLTYTT